jgi:hypothetical protein
MKIFKMIHLHVLDDVIIWETCTVHGV